MTPEPDPQSDPAPESLGALESLFAAAWEGFVDPDEIPPTVPGCELTGGEANVWYGGMGVVYVGRECEPDRPVAVKVISQALARDARANEHFRAERQICAELQHPGIVPVYRVGELPDGRPYYLMKLVNGQTLGQTLQERAHPSHDLVKFLGVFHRVCEALGYAHARGIIHRDLKPANVMVGEHDDEVLLMDWGLAERVDGRPAGAASERPAQPGHSDGRGWGTGVGSPAYMPPEQAEPGRDHEVDRRSDVFGLGGILCHVLTGEAPYRGSVEDIMPLVLRADLTDAFRRLDDSRADPALIGLARRCLAARKADRPPDAGAVADAVKAYLARLENDAREAMVQRGRADEERRRRRTQGILALVTLLLFAGLGGGAWWYQNQRATRTAANSRKVTEAVDRLRETRDRGLKALLDDEGQRRRAERIWGEVRAGLAEVEELAASDVDDSTRQRADELLAEVRQQADAAEKDLRTLERIERIRDARFEDVRDEDIERAGLDIEFAFSNRGAEAFAVAFRDYGIDVLSLPAPAAADLIRGSRIRQHLVDALHDWHLIRRGQESPQLLDVARAADPDTRRESVRAGIASRNTEVLVPLAAEAEKGRWEVRTLRLLGEGLYELGRREEAVSVLRFARREFPHDYWVNHLLGLYVITIKSPNYDEASECFAVACALRPNASTPLIDLGVTLRNQGRSKEAVSLHRKALALAGANRGYAAVNYALSLLASGDGEEADTVCQQIMDAASGQAWIYAQVAKCYADRRRFKEAWYSLEKAQLLSPESLSTLTAIGFVHAKQERREDAVRAYEKALTRNPNSFSTLCEFGALLAEAQESRHEGIKHLSKAVTLKPWDAFGWWQLGQAQYNALDITSAVTSLRRAFAMNNKNYKFCVDFALALAADGQHEEAEVRINEMEQYIPVGEKSRFRQNLLAYRGNRLLLKGTIDGAVKDLREAAGLDPRDTTVLHGLGLALFKMKDYDGAIDAYRRLAACSPDDAGAYDGIGTSYLEKKDYDGAIAAYRRSVQIKKTASVFYRLGIALMWKRDYSGASEAYREATRLAPKDADAHHWLGMASELNGDWPGAVAAYEQAHQLRVTESGLDHPATLLTASKLATAYCAAKHGEKAAPLFKRWIDSQRNLAKKDDPAFASKLAAVSLSLLRAQQYREAESYLRECLVIRERVEPQTWSTFVTKSMLGHCLMVRRDDRAEELLLSGYEGLQERKKDIPAAAQDRLAEALERLIQFYTDTNQPDKVAKWKALRRLEVAPPPREVTGR